MKNNNDLQKDSYSSKISLAIYVFFQRHPFFRKLKLFFYFIDSFLLLFIKKPLNSNNSKKKVLLIYNYAFGDGVIWLCSVSKIRSLYPSEKYNLTLICQKGINKLYEAQNIFDEVIPFDLTKSTFDLKKRYELFKKLREKKYDIVIDSIGVGECTTNVFMSRALVADQKISSLDITLKYKLCPKFIYKKIYTKIIEISIPDLSLIEYYSIFFQKLGIKDKKVDFYKLKSQKYDFKLPERYFIIFIGASTNLKKWPVERYAQLVNKIYKQTKMPAVICGTKDDQKAVDDFKMVIKNNVPLIDLVSKTNLLEFIDVIKRAALVITNDTSTYHIAITQEIPVVIIAGGYTYNKYVKYDFTGNEYYKKPCIVVNERDCFNCDNRCKYLKRSDQIWPCLNDITLDYAWKKVKEYIKDRKI